MLADAPSAMKHEIMGLFALNMAPLFWGVDAESCAGTTSAAGAGGVGVAAGASTDDSAEGVGSDATDSELDSDS
jgi:hypothetical protein